MTGSIQLRINTSVQTFPAEIANFALQSCTFCNRKALSSFCSSCSLPQPAQLPGLKPRPSTPAPGSQGCDSRMLHCPGEPHSSTFGQSTPAKVGDLQHLENRSPESTAQLPSNLRSATADLGEPYGSISAGKLGQDWEK